MTPAIERVGVFAPWPELAAYGAELPDLAAELEQLGYGALWASVAQADLGIAEPILGATKEFVFATGIVNIWTESPAELISAFHASPYRDRLLLGIGAGHRERNTGQGYSTPKTAIGEYLDKLTDIPAAQLVLAALGPRMLELAARRTAGAHPYLVVPEHTAAAREILGAGPLLAPEQKVVLETDPATARAIARKRVVPYLGLENYVANFRRFGFGEQDFAEGGSDRLIDALVVWGGEEAITRRVRAHLDAGADQVAVQVLTGDGEPRSAYRALAPALTAL
ncbi:TIGR03620 family F420-dependent LLM class oxidoreductase [Sciscionella marina]|uniref:TIGR03620 family F420-dependent LLM class oxidoreductase n=1 Tax=Sciscionella marina TaxID=508770 RepID=UPI0004754657|nr:TIGR03620 family F420-dependent LLM class oxidoreductase [Sciscionella marina]